MQRYIVIKNDFSKDVIYPVVEVLEANWDKNRKGVRRIFMNISSESKGISPGKQMRINLPEQPWYNGGRVYLFAVDPRKFESLPGIDSAWKTEIDPALKPDCGTNFCEGGHANSAYGDDVPFQLIEYTFDAYDPKTGAPPPDHNFDAPGLVAMADVDVSYVDSVYLPAAISLDDKGVSNYMGTLMPFELFKQRSDDFLKQAKWSKYAPYAPENWNNTYFKDLISQDSIYYQLPNIPSGNFIFNAVRRSENNARVAPSKLYNLNIPVMACNAQDNAGAYLFPLCKTLAGNCCAADHITNGFHDILDCCPQKAFVLDKTKAGAIFDNLLYTADNETVDLYAKRWKAWVDTDPCANIQSISKWPSTEKEFDAGKKMYFCTKFKESVNFIWDHFKNDPVNPCTVGTDHEKDICIIRKIISYDVPKGAFMGGKLPETLQAVMRGVPYVAASFDLFVTPKRDPADKTRRNTFLIVQDEKALYELNEDGNQRLILDASALPALLDKVKPGNTYLTNKDHAEGWSIKDDFADDQLAQMDVAIQAKVKLPESLLLPPANFPMDKWLAFWIPYDSDDGNLFSLNPYTHFVHDSVDGIDAQSYSFSIDDKYGNFRDQAKGFIIDVGGSSAILNRTMFDPFDQYKINWSGNASQPDKAWQQVTITPSDSSTGPVKTDTPALSFDKTTAIYPMNSHIVFNRYVSGKASEAKFSYITMTDAQGNHVDFKLSLETKPVKDNFTGKMHTVRTLTKDDAYCQAQSSDLLQPMCTQSNLSALNSGNTYYPQLNKADRPKINLNVGLPNVTPPVPISFPVQWMKGELTEKNKATISWSPAKLSAAAKKSGDTIHYIFYLEKDGGLAPACETNDPVSTCKIDVAKPANGMKARVLAQAIKDGKSEFEANFDGTLDLLNPVKPTMTWDDYSNQGAFDIQASNTSATVVWKAASISNQDVPQYSVTLNGNAVPSCTNIAGTNCSLNGLTENTKYTVNVMAVDSNAEHADVKQTKTQAFSTAAGAYTIDWPGDISVNIEGGRTGKAIISWNYATISDGSTPYYNVIVQGNTFCQRQTTNTCTLDWNRWSYHQVYVYAYKLGDEKNAKVKAKSVN